MQKPTDLDDSDNDDDVDMRPVKARVFGMVMVGAETKRGRVEVGY